MAFGVSPYSYQNYMNTSMQGNGQMNVPQGSQFNAGAMQNYGQFQQPPQFIKGRPVSGVEEARAAMIDLDGSIFVFPDITNRKIYTKQILLDGSAEVKTYVFADENEPEEKVEKQEKQTNNKKYVLKSEYDKSLKNLNLQIKKLTEKLEGIKDENESDADV